MKSFVCFEKKRKEQKIISGKSKQDFYPIDDLSRDHRCRRM